MKTIALLLLGCAACGGAPFSSEGYVDPSIVVVDAEPPVPTAEKLDPPPVADAQPPVIFDAGLPDADAAPDVVVAPLACVNGLDETGQCNVQRITCFGVLNTKACPGPYSTTWTSLTCIQGGWACCTPNDATCTFQEDGGVLSQPDADPPTVTSCQSLKACNGCTLIGTVEASEQAGCMTAVNNNDYTSCNGYLAAIRAGNFSCP